MNHPPDRLNKRRVELWIKRLFDMLFSSLVLIVLSPLFAMVALLIRTALGSPIFFRQRRPGLSEKRFYMLKFRTMKNLYNPDGNLLQDKERLTRLGNILRKLSIDELPQFWNVFKGDMSIVGPRPLLEKYIGRYSAQHARRHDMKPGITGWAQVQGRTDIPMSERLNLDVWYIDHFSILLDMRIIFLTVATLFKQSSTQINQDVLAVDDLNLTDMARQKRRLND